MSALTIFLIVMSNFILLIGAGLFTKAVSAFQQHAYVCSPSLPFPITHSLITASTHFLAAMSTTRAVQVQAPTMSVAASGISTAVRPMRRRVLRGGPSLPLSSDGRITLLVRRKHIEITYYGSYVASCSGKRSSLRVLLDRCDSGIDLHEIQRGPLIFVSFLYQPRSSLLIS